MASVKITTKRQATLPKDLCEEIGVAAGDSLLVERRVVGGEAVWVLRRQRDPWSWTGRAKKYARNKSHDLDEVRRSVARAKARGGR